MTTLFENTTLVNYPLKTILSKEISKKQLIELQLLAIVMRKKILEMGYVNQIRLHYGALMSMIEIITILYMHWLDIDPDNLKNNDRDRFILSKGHGAPALYVALWMRGFFEESHFSGFRRLNSILQGHPDINKTPGVETSSGSLGQGFPVSVGMGLSNKMDGYRYGVYCLISDGECNEGSIWEAAQIASNLKVGKLTVLIDRNKKSSYTWMKDRNDIEPLDEKWKSFNWNVLHCDGHDFTQLSQALFEAETISNKPTVIICHTVKGKGIPYVENYPTKPNILLTENTFKECMDHLELIQKELESENE